MTSLKSYLKFWHFPTYGVASIGKVAVEMMLQLYLFDLYTRILGLSPLWAGVAFAIAIFWDAVSDVCVAVGLLYLRKRGFLYSTVIFFGAIILAGSISVLFDGDSSSSQPMLFFQLLLAYIGVNTGMTLVDLPQTSLSAELSADSAERNRLLACRLGLGILGLIIGSILPGLFLLGEGAESLAHSRAVGGWVVAVLVLITGAFTAFGLRGADRQGTANFMGDIPTWSESFSVLEQKAFREILYASLVAAVGRTVNSALALMYYRLVLDLSEETVTRLVFPVFTFSIVLSIPLWTYLSKVYGKARPAWISVGLLGLMGIVSYPVLPVGVLWPVMLVSMVGGVFCGAVFLVDSMITDIIDQDDEATGKRKEAVFFAVQKSAVKFSRAIAFICVGVGLDIFGLDVADASVGVQEKWVIIALFAFFVGGCFVVSSFFLCRVEESLSQIKVVK